MIPPTGAAPARCYPTAPAGARPHCRARAHAHGFIGSETKRARFINFARQVGVAECDIDRLVCPIGVSEIKGKEPAIIAASLAAQLIMLREQVLMPQQSLAMQPA